MRPALILPARDEASSIGDVLRRVPPSLGATVVVVDNGSVDGTADIASAMGADVVVEPRAGYGWACLAGARRARHFGCDVLVFLDADGSMAPEDVVLLLAPIRADSADLVLGVRRHAAGSMPLHQRMGNRVIGLLLRWHGVRVCELGPFRAIRTSTWSSIGMSGSRFAWPAEMIALAAAAGARITQVTVDSAARTGGRSKVGGSLRGTVAATWDIGRVLLTRASR